MRIHLKSSRPEVWNCQATHNVYTETSWTSLAEWSLHVVQIVARVIYLEHTSRHGENKAPGHTCSRGPCFPQWHILRVRRTNLSYHIFPIDNSIETNVVNTVNISIIYVFDYFKTNIENK